MKVIDKQAEEGKPEVLDMHEHDARHAAAADPERYEIVPKTTAELRGEARARMSLAQRVAAVEAILDEIVSEDELARHRANRVRRERAEPERAAEEKTG